MRYFSNLRYFLLVLLLSANTFLTFLLPVLGNDAISQTPVPKAISEDSKNEEEVIGLPLSLPKPTSAYVEKDKSLVEEPEEIKLSSPTLIINDKKIILNRVPIYDGKYWLFPLEEIATELQDSVQVDTLQKIITVTRFRDRAVIRLNVSNGTITINNNPFRILDGFEHIILGTEVQLIPASAVAILHGLSLSVNDEDNSYSFRSVLSGLVETQGTIQPQVQKGFSKFKTSFFNSTASVNDFHSADILSRRLELNAGGRNNVSSITSNLILRSGTGGPAALIDTGYINYFKTDSPLQAYIGDRTLSTLRSPFLGGVILRGAGFQSGGFVKDSMIISGIGFIPSANRLEGKAESFLRFGRAAHLFEWSSSPKKNWQFSFGEALFKDTIKNVFIDGKQTGGVLTSNVVKTGMLLEGEGNLAFGFADDKRDENFIVKVDDTPKIKSRLVSDQRNGIGSDLLVRLKPKQWFSLFGKGGYYGSDFFSLSGNSYYHDRNELTGGFNFGFSMISFGASGTTGKLNLDKKTPDKYNLINVFSNYTPLKKGPTLSLNYSKNLSKINPDRAFFILSNPILMASQNTLSFDDIIARNSTSNFRLGLIQNWQKTNFSANYNKIGLDQNTNVQSSVLGGNSSDTFTSYDFNVNRIVNSKLSLLNFSQFSENFKQISWGARVGPLFNGKLNFQAQYGLIDSKTLGITPQYNLNLNFLPNKKISFSAIYEKTTFQERIFGLVRYNFIGDQNSGNPAVQQVISSGRILGRVYIKPDNISNLPTNQKNISIGKGLSNVRIYLSNNIYVTDKNGYFEINDLPPASYKITVDYSDIPAYLASLSNESIDLVVEKGKETNYDFVLTHYGSADGKVVLEGENPDLKDVEETSIEGFRVYLENTDFEGLTDSNGNFVIGDVKPGKYKVLVDPDYLPENLEVEDISNEIEVKAKQKTEEIVLKIKYKSRNTQEKEF